MACTYAKKNQNSKYCHKTTLIKKDYRDEIGIIYCWKAFIFYNMIGNNVIFTNHQLEVM